MSDRRLQVFHTVARLLSFTKAAESLEMTQPAVTFQVRQLEEEFNVRLFDRSHNKIDLTEAGRRAYQYAEKIFGVYGEMEQAMRDVTGQVGGPLKIGTSMFLGDYLLPGLIADYSRMFPSIDFHLKLATNSNVVSMIENSSIDLGLIEGDVESKSLEVVPYQEETYFLVVPSDHPWSQESQISIEKLSGQPLILRDEGPGSVQSLEKKVTLSPVLELSSAEAIKSSIEQSLGLGILPERAFLKEKRLDLLTGVPLEPRLTAPLNFVFKKQKFPLRVLDEFIQFALSSSREEGALRSREGKGKVPNKVDEVV